MSIYEPPPVQAFILAAAIEAVVAGKAVVSEDGNEVRWDEPDCLPGMDKMVGIARGEEGGWVALVETSA